MLDSKFDQKYDQKAIKKLKKAFQNESEFEWAHLFFLQSIQENQRHMLRLMLGFESPSVHKVERRDIFLRNVSMLLSLEQSSYKTTYYKSINTKSYIKTTSHPRISIFIQKLHKPHRPSNKLFGCEKSSIRRRIVYTLHRLEQEYLEQK